MENQGDIDAQTLAGAISTATHGTGATFRNISSQVEAVRLVTAAGPCWTSAPTSPTCWAPPAWAWARWAPSAP